MGVLAVYGVPNASTLLYYGLHNLQHRGQEGGGIATFDEDGKSYRHRGLGLLNEVFSKVDISTLSDIMVASSADYCKGGAKAGVYVSRQIGEDIYVLAAAGNGECGVLISNTGKDTEIKLDTGKKLRGYLIDEDNFYKEKDLDTASFTLKENQVIYLEGQI